MTQQLVVGGYLIDYANIYQVTSLTAPGSAADTVVHYRPIRGTDKVFTESVPLKMLSKSGLRPLITSSEIEALYQALKTNSDDYSYLTLTAKDEIFQNSPLRLAPLLKYLWKNGDQLPKADQDLKATMFNHLVMEIAFVSQKPPSEVRNQLETALNL